jgi:hypothetical protein
MNPYDNNPFEIEDRKDPKNEHDANRQLAKTTERHESTDLNSAFNDLYDTINFIARVHIK